jgi:chloride channel protein, CIC family
VRQATCALVLAKFPDRAAPTFERWLVPTAGGPNSRQALRLLPGLVNLGKAATVQLCHIQNASQNVSQNASQTLDLKSDLTCKVESDFADRSDDDRTEHLTPALQEALAALQNRLSVPVTAKAATANEIAPGIIQQQQQQAADVILLGATQAGLLEQVMNGNIPTAVARGCDCTVILVRGPL